MQDDAVPAPVLANGIHYFGLVFRAEKMLILQFVEGRIGAGADIDAVKRNPAFQFADILVPLGMGAPDALAPASVGLWPRVTLFQGIFINKDRSPVVSHVRAKFPRKPEVLGRSNKTLNRS